MAKTKMEIPLWGKIGIAAVGYFAVLRPAMQKYGSNSNVAVDMANNAIDTNNLTKPTAWYTSAADTLEEAMNGTGTNEDAVYNIFQQLTTGSDLMKLISVFGVRYYEAGTFYSGSGYKNLAEFITADFEGDEIDVINNIIQSKGINFYF